MTTGAAPPRVAELLENARAATSSPELRRLLGAILDAGATGLFEARSFAPEQLLYPFNAPAELWIVGRGQVYVERRSAQGRGLRPLCVTPGGLLGTVPGGEARDWPPSADGYARAITTVHAAVLPGTAFADLRARLPDMEGTLEFLDLSGRLAESVDLQLRAVPGLTLLSSETLGELYQRAERVSAPDGACLLSPGTVPDRFYVVLDGVVTSCRTEADGRRKATPEGAGRLVGLVPFLAQAPGLDECTVGVRPEDEAAGHPSLASMHPRRADGALLAAIPTPAWRELLATHPLARRGIEVLPPADTWDLVVVQSDVRGAPLGAMTTLLARALRDDFGDRVAIVHLLRPGAPTPPTTDVHGTPTLVARAAAASDVPAALRALLQAEIVAGRPRDLLFLWPEPADAGFVDAAAPLVSRVAWLSESCHSAPVGAYHGARLDRAAYLGPLGSPKAHPWPTGTVRLRLDPDVLRKRAATPGRLTRVDGREKATVAGIRRWGRALTERLVGLALGGGGSPGFAHVALIRSLEKRVPIDLVAGTSFGALVGAWYAGVRQNEIAEPARLQTMLDAGRALNFCQAVGLLDTGLLAHLVDKTFDGIRLADLERPFFPVSSEVDSGTVYVGRGTTLGRAVQMSGAFPPIFPPVIRGPYARLVDGGFVNNVPASVLRSEGASFVIASNSIGLVPPRPVKTDHPRVRRVLAGLNPAGRIEDAARAGMLLFHRVGDAQSLFADFAYESAYTGYEFWNFNRGQVVIDQVQEAADTFAARVAAGWRARARHADPGLIVEWE